MSSSARPINVGRLVLLQFCRIQGHGGPSVEIYKVWDPLEQTVYVSCMKGLGSIKDKNKQFIKSNPYRELVVGRRGITIAWLHGI